MKRVARNRRRERLYGRGEALRERKGAEPGVLGERNERRVSALDETING